MGRGWQIHLIYTRVDGDVRLVAAADKDGLKRWEKFSDEDRRRIYARAVEAFDTPFYEGATDKPNIGSVKWEFRLSDQDALGRIEMTDYWLAEQRIPNYRYYLDRGMTICEGFSGKTIDKRRFEVGRREIERR